MGDGSQTLPRTNATGSSKITNGDVAQMLPSVMLHELRQAVAESSQSTQFAPLAPKQRLGETCAVTSS